MSKLIRHIIILVVLITLILYGYDRLIYALSPDVREYHQEVKTLESSRFISLGNSEGIRIKWGLSNKDTLANLCLSGSDFCSSADVFFTLLKHISPDQIVLLNFNNTSFYELDPTYEKDLRELSSQTQLFYYNLPLSMLNRNDFLKYLKSRLYLVNSVQNTEMTFSNLMRILLPSKLYRKIKTNKGDKVSLITGTAKGADFDHFAVSQKSTIIQSVNNTVNAEARIFGVLKAMKKAADEHHIRIIAYSCPRHSRYREVFGEKLYDSTSFEIRKNLEKLEITYFDHLSDPSFSNDSSYFHDSAHLNLKGAIKFDKILFNEIAGLHKP